MEALNRFASKFSFDVGYFSFSPQGWQVGAIVFLLFLLVLTLASVRRHFLEYSARGAGFGFLLGFVMAIIIESFFLLKGRTALTEVLGWKNAPKPIQVALDQSRSQFQKVLGMQSVASTPKPTWDGVVSMYQTLTSSDQDKVEALVCK